MHPEDIVNTLSDLKCITMEGESHIIVKDEEMLDTYRAKQEKRRALKSTNDLVIGKSSCLEPVLFPKYVSGVFCCKSYGRMCRASFAASLMCRVSWQVLEPLPS